MLSSLQKFICLIALLFAINVQSHKVDPKINDKCSVELEGIIFRQRNCTFEYFKRLEIKFRAGGEHLLFTTQASPFIKSFSNTYQLIILVSNPFGFTDIYDVDGTTTSVPLSIYPETAQTFINFPGFIRQVNNGNFYYAFPVFSSDGQYLLIKFKMEHSRDVVLC